jgi:diguanylate cyclase (GGDEF)-like protein
MSISKLIVARSACASSESNAPPREIPGLPRFETGRFECVAIRSDGLRFPVEIAVTPIQVVQGEALLTAYIRDISRQKEHEEALRHLSLIDDLTGLHNRRGFILFAESLLRTAERMRCCAWLLFTDMNALKEINDTYGHPEGDRALRALGKVLQKTFRRSDVVARIGGDEFAILALDSRRRGAEGMIARLNERLHAFNQQPGRAYALSVSIGYAQYDPENPSTLDELLVEGDAMMYEQKRASRRSGRSPFSSVHFDVDHLSSLD